jgi:hypothetical protein
MNKKTITLFVALATVAASSLAFAAPDHTQDHMGNMPGQSSMMTMKDIIAKTGTFKGVEAKTGYANLAKKNGKHILSVSADFTVPPSPAPHWQVVDKDGNVFLLQRFTIVGDKVNREIVLPSYIKSVAKVQVWCSFAEVLLGEASFAQNQMLRN